MKYFQFFLAVFLLPVLAALIWNFYSIIINLAKNVSTNSLPFWLGLGSYFLFQLVFFKPIRTYVFGHELTHAIVGFLSGARLKRFKVSSSGGSVILTKSNLWIALAPYFVPLYTVLLIIVYQLGSRFFPLYNYYPYYLFVIGFSLSFHFSLTHFAIKQGQKDIKQFGTFFSFVFIIIISVLLLVVILKFIFPEMIGIKSFFYNSSKKSIYIYEKVKEICCSFLTMK